MKKPWCILLTGPPNCGKSTLTYLLVQKRFRNVLIIDGDKHREMQFLGENLGFTDEDILKNNRHVIKLAQFAQDQEINVVIAQIAPLIAQRREMRENLKNFIEAKLGCPRAVRAKRANYVDTELVYQFSSPDLFVNTQKHSEEICVNQIIVWMSVHEYL